MNTLPTNLVVHRLLRNLEEKDHLLALLDTVADGFRLTNRMNEALILVPADTMAEILRTLGRDT